MIGSEYWSTGVRLRAVNCGDGWRWQPSLRFSDGGFAEGELRCRYPTSDPVKALATLLADAKRLGLIWAWPNPSVYPEDEDGMEMGASAATPEQAEVLSAVRAALGADPVLDVRRQAEVVA